MDWPMIIERNAERLIAVAHGAVRHGGLRPGRDGAYLPRHVCRALLILLRPAESAVRRLIIMAARGLVVKLRRRRAAFPAGLVLNRDAERVAAFCLIDPLKRFAPEGFEWGRNGGAGPAAHFRSRPLRPGLPAAMPISTDGRPHLPQRHPPPPAGAATCAGQSAASGEAAGALAGAAWA